MDHTLSIPYIFQKTNYYVLAFHVMLETTGRLKPWYISTTLHATTLFIVSA